MHKVPFIKRDRQTDGRTDGLTDRQTDKLNPISPRFHGGNDAMHVATCANQHCDVLFASWSKYGFWKAQLLALCFLYKKKQRQACNKTGEQYHPIDISLMRIR